MILTHFVLPVTPERALVISSGQQMVGGGGGGEQRKGSFMASK